MTNVRKGSRVGVQIGRNVVAAKVVGVTDGKAEVELESGNRLTRLVGGLRELPPKAAPKAQPAKAKDADSEE